MTKKLYLVGGPMGVGKTTVCLWLDSLIYDYYSFAFVFGSALIRFGKDIVIVAIVTTIVIPLMKLLRRGGLVPALN